MEIDAAPSVTDVPHVPRTIRAHAWLAALVVCVLVGAGFRLIPNSTAAPTSGTGAASTACAAK